VIDININTPIFDNLILTKLSTNYHFYFIYLSIILVGIITIYYTTYKNYNNIVGNHINFSGPAKKLGEKIVQILTVGAATGGTYVGGKEIVKDVNNALQGYNSNNTGSTGNNNSNGSNKS